MGQQQSRWYTVIAIGTGLMLAMPAIAHAAQQQSSQQQDTESPATLREQALTRERILQAMEAQPQREPIRQLNTDALREALAQRAQGGQQTPDTATPDIQTQEPERDAQGRPVASIDWNSAATDMRRDMAQMNQDTPSAFVPTQPPPRVPPFRNTQPEELMRPRLPVLLPLETEPAHTRGEEEGGGVEGMMFFASDYFYSASFHRRGIMYQINGSRVIHAVETSAAIAGQYMAMTDAQGQLVTRTEFGQELSFNRYGAAYTLLLACSNPDENAECRDENTIRALAGRLVVAGGSPEGLPPRNNGRRQP
ncbi:hypothetical protein X907_0950 [Glycocaulis alkaliphilus]|uniref:Uncharacterized protein n=1 Tax=Glycocaulis alkaliphilus TaxID=1434191 RepID=A0A3T0E8B1_9PROT|nr:hypothetical protein [Glycocaulis alkaliphilus]AZU03490.1 hypothetical protein X907_0950 [Glycocaulis alkaliphilus]GGB73892.1 hypothetical protein GCM10007417_12200 [Glycocaulis alkaliphilus]